jgi:hypothetical protein
MLLACRCNWHSCRGEVDGDVCRSVKLIAVGVVFDGSFAKGARPMAWYSGEHASQRHPVRIYVSVSNTY